MDRVRRPSASLHPGTLFADRLAMHAMQLGDLIIGMTGLVKHYNRINQAHVELRELLNNFRAPI